MLNRVRAIVISLVSALLLCVAPVLCVAHAVGVETPDWVGSGGGSRSFLEGRTLSSFPDVSLHAFRGGSFQSGIESFLSDSAPCRDGALYATAGAQRAAIGLAAVPFGFECYPAYFDSSAVVVPKGGGIQSMSLVGDGMLKSIDGFCEKLAAFAESRPDLRFVVVMPSGDTTPAVSPLYDLIASRMDADEAASRFSMGIEGLDNVFLATDAGSYPGTDEYYEYYYRTDHHWNLRGAVRCFNAAAVELGIEPFSEGEINPIDGVAAMGSNAREARWFTSEPLVDTYHDFSGVEIAYDSGETVNANEHFAAGGTELERMLDFYNGYYRWENHRASGPGNRRALVIGDSFVGVIYRVIEERYSESRVVADAYWRNKEGSLAERLEESQADDVYFVGTAVDLVNMASRIPGYFDVS